MRYHNALMETTPDAGIAVDYNIPDGYYTSKKELGDKSEPLLAKALDLILGATTLESKEASSNTSRATGNVTVKEIGPPSFFKFISEFPQNYK